MEQELVEYCWYQAVPGESGTYTVLGYFATVEEANAEAVRRGLASKESV